MTGPVLKWVAGGPAGIFIEDFQLARSALRFFRLTRWLCRGLEALTGPSGPVFGANSGVEGGRSAACPETFSRAAVSDTLYCNRSDVVGLAN
jgi:hypothetical protein